MPTLMGELFETAGYSRRKHFFLDDEYLAAGSADYFRDNLNSLDVRERPIHLFRFDHAVVVGQGTVVLSDGSLLTNSCAEFINHGQVPEGMEGTIDDISYTAPQKEIPGTAILVKRPWYRNFGHFLVDLMPILPAMQKSGVEADHIIFGDVPNGPLKVMMGKCAHEFFPNAEVHFTDDRMPLKVERLLYTQPVHVPPLFKHPLAMNCAKETSINLFGGSESLDFDSSRLYVSRQTASYRHVANNEELEDFLKGRGFHVFHPEKYSFGQQIEAFRRATLVVGVKGAALTNLLFCGGGAHALVFSSPQFVDAFFWDVAAVSGVNYSEIFCKAANDDGPATVDVQVDLGKVEKFLSLI